MTARRALMIGWLVCICGLHGSRVASAQCLPDVYLTIGYQDRGLPVSRPGRADASAVPEIHRMTEAQILSVPTTVLDTGTNWTPVSRFEGPRLHDVLRPYLGDGRAATAILKVTALNGYSVTIPVADLERYDPVLAHTRDGVRMRRSEFGPLFLVYPRDRHRELRAPNMAARMVWQVCRIDVE
ncbi:MAG: hypothetical protein EOO28_34990 [Comamonadaceae bacterium]|nr:MAG: hypothetical protein EOO28_34990 [Comamonadaceae bacterium]